MHLKFTVYFLLVYVICCYCGVVSNISNLFELSVIHVNDFHGRFDETSDSAGKCKPGVSCIGGFSRMYRQIMTMIETNPEVLLLHGGDAFAGTLWYTVGKWNITQEFMNKLPFAASALGNHEFEDNLEGLVPYMKALRYPILVANMDASKEPMMKGLYQKSTVVERRGKKIGIIGVLVSTVGKINNISNLEFALESPSINEEAERLVREEGVFTNIVLSHAGYDIDQEIAANASDKISLIVGAHTHTFLWTGGNPPGPDEVGGPYPTIIKNPLKQNVLIVQASSYCRYVGNITIYLNEDGEVVDYSGAPIFLSNQLSQDETINKELEPWRDLVDAVPNPVVASSFVTLNKWKCSYKECTLGNFVADAMVFSHAKNVTPGTWTTAAIAVADSEGMRANIEIGDITEDDLNTSLPYDNTWDVGELKGKELKRLFEYNTIRKNGNEIVLRILQVSGIKLVLNLTLPEGERVQSLKVRCQNCTVPIYENVEPDKDYKIIVESFLRNGGYNYSVLVDNIKNVVIGPPNKQMLREYLKHRSPIFEEEDERFVIYGYEPPY